MGEGQVEEEGESTTPELPDVLLVVEAGLGDVVERGLPAAEHLALGRQEPLHRHHAVLRLHVREPDQTNKYK